MIDTFIIPRKEAILALDLVSASLLNNVDEGIALSNTDTYLRIKTLYNFNSINSRFAQLVLRLLQSRGTSTDVHASTHPCTLPIYTI